jgi:hypothetical protein
MELREALRELQSELAVLKIDDIPEGWHTVEQWAEIDGRAFSTVSAILLSGWRSGKVERDRFCVDLGGMLRKVWHYRVKPKGYVI